MNRAQHPIDLLPDSMRARTEARLAASRNIGIIALVVGIVVALLTHARVVRDRAEERLSIKRSEAAEVEDLARRADDIRERLADIEAFMDAYHAVETPVAIHRIVATVVSQMPDSMTLTQIDIDADTARRARRSRTAKRPTAELPPRLLVAEVSGFAGNDRDVTTFVQRLEDQEPFRAVSLDFSRQGEVRGVPAREFRLSFEVDFESRYVHRAAALTSEGEVAHAE